MLHLRAVKDLLRETRLRDKRRKNAFYRTGVETASSCLLYRCAEITGLVFYAHSIHPSWASVHEEHVRKDCR